MKKIAAFILAFAMAMSLVACGGTANDSELNTNGDVVNSTASGQGQNSEMELMVYQDGSTLTATIFGTQVATFNQMLKDGRECQLNIDFCDAEDDIYSFMAYSDPEFSDFVYFNELTEFNDTADASYSKDSLSFAFNGFDGDFSAVKTAYVFIVDGDEFIFDREFNIQDVMTDSNTFDGSMSSGSNGSGGSAMGTARFVDLVVDTENITMTVSGDPIALMVQNIAQNPLLRLVFKDAAGNDIGTLQLDFYEGEWCGSFEDSSYATGSFNGEISPMLNECNDETITCSFEWFRCDFDPNAIDSVSLEVTSDEMNVNGENYYLENCPMQIDLAALGDAQAAEAMQYVGIYHVYNRPDYTDPMTVTEDTITYIHEGQSHTIPYDLNDLTAFGGVANCFTTTVEDDFVVVEMRDGYLISFYINYFDQSGEITDNEDWKVYDYKKDDEISTVDAAFVAKYAGTYEDIESGENCVQFTLEQDGTLTVTMDDVQYTADSVIGCELVNGSSVKTTLISDAERKDATINFYLRNDGIVWANINNYYAMERQ